MAGMKKKPDLAVLIGVGKPKKGADGEEPEQEAGEDSESAYHDAFHELAEALGVPPDQTDAAKGAAAFRVLHDLCAEEEEGGEEYQEKE